MRGVPFVSVVIPVLNGEKDVRDCLAALRNQDYPASRYEIIVVDNGSTDDTVKHLKDAGLTCYFRHKRGRACALNKGIEQAKGEIISSTDISCRPEPTWISYIARSFQDPSVGCVGGEIKLADPAEQGVVGYQKRHHYMSPIYAQRVRKLPFLPYADGANASFRKQVFNDVGPFDEAFIKGADVEICYRIWIFSNYRVIFNKRATVWERGEATLGALLKQRFRIGVGHVLMKVKYDRLFSRTKEGSLPKRVYWKSRWLLFYLSRLASANVRGLDGKDARTKAFDNNTEALMRISQNIGELYGVIWLKTVGVAPAHVDPKKIDIFLSRVDGMTSSTWR